MACSFSPVGVQSLPPVHERVSESECDYMELHVRACVCVCTCMYIFFNNVVFELDIQVYDDSDKCILLSQRVYVCMYVQYAYSQSVGPSCITTSSTFLIQTHVGSFIQMCIAQGFLSIPLNP